MKNRSWCRGAIAMAVAFLSLSAAAGAQQQWWECPTTVPTECANVEDQQALREIPVLAPPDGGKELSTTFDVQMKTFCVSTGTKVGTKPGPDNTTINIFSAKPLQLRTYVYTDPKTNKTLCGFPGPTLRVRKAGEDGKGGQGIAILLKNSLPVASDTECANACPASVPSCDCDPEKLKALVATCSVPQPAPAQCCCLIQCTQKAPNCFHGSNTTNLHFHGSHASPQEPQDFVLLELRPGKAPTAGATKDSDVHLHGEHGPYSKVAYGQYQYRVDPFGFGQSEGTHWYHPHKHGSVGQQVANGMAGAMIIDGPFDDWLNKLLGNPEEKLMVIQQLAPATNLFRQGIPRPVLVNGQVSPKVTVEPGEIQRWRIANATMSSQAMLQITFDPRLVIRQIALDGVRFSPMNFYCQPLANFDPKKPPAAFPCDPNVKLTQLTLAPGNRADFLVLMPLQESTKDNPPLRIERRLVDIVGEEGSQRQILRDLDEAVAPGIPEPALFHVDVDDGIEGNDDQPKLLKAGAPKMPEKLEMAMPPHLAVVKDAQVDQKVTMTFEQAAAVTGQPWPYSGSPISKFQIDGKQFDGTCVNVTTKLGTQAEWTVSNATQLPHPFHIHTNPFQLTDYNGAKLPGVGALGPEPIWMDTLPLPLATLVPCADPANCPGALPCALGSTNLCTLKTASMSFRQRYEQFTGEYVLHCHFLGHEDRGMMFAVQTECKNKPGFFAKGGVDAECKGELLPVVKPCT